MIKKNYYSIHWNKRDKKKLRILKEFFKNYKNVNIFCKRKVFWGHSSILNVVIDHANFFLKTKEEIFLNLCNKTVNLKNINECEEIIKKEIKSGKNFFDYNRMYLQFYKQKEIQYHKNHCFIMTNEEIWRRKFYWKLKYNTKWFKMNYFFSIAFLFLKHPNKMTNIFKKVCFGIGGVNIFQEIENEFFLNSKNSPFEEYFISKSKRKIPKILKKWDFIFHTQIGSFLCISRKDMITILQSKEFKKYWKILKKSIYPEEYFFSNLYYNLIDNSIKNSLIINVNLQNWEKLNIKEWQNIYNSILFLRRVKGKEKINELNSIVSNCIKKNN